MLGEFKGKSGTGGILEEEVGNCAASEQSVLGDGVLRQQQLVVMVGAVEQVIDDLSRQVFDA